MGDIARFVIDNKEWIFSGIGVAAISTLVWLFRRKRGTSLRQIQKSGDHSFNVQAGRDSISYYDNGARNDKQSDPEGR
jgi:hypothetical protein